MVNHYSDYGLSIPINQPKEVYEYLDKEFKIDNKKIEIFTSAYIKSAYKMGELREDGIWQKDEDGGKNFAAAINDLLHIVEKYNITPEQYEMGDIFLKRNSYH